MEEHEQIPKVSKADPVEHNLSQLSEADFPLQKDKELLREWRDRVQHLHVMQDFVRHPAVAEFVQIGLQRIEAIDRKFKERDLLINPGRAMERVALAVERDVHEMYLEFFNVNPDGELADIGRNVEEAMKHL